MSSSAMFRSTRYATLLFRRNSFKSFCFQSKATTNVSVKYLKYGFGATLVGVLAASGYATCAYSVDEFEERTKKFQSLARNTVREDGSALAKFQAAMYSSALSVPVKATELYMDLRRFIGEHLQVFTEPISDKLLPDQHPTDQSAFTLVLDLHETLVDSEWKSGRGWRTYKRPGVDDFLEHLAKFYEIVVYSDRKQGFVDPIVEKLDPNHRIRYKLSWAATKYQNGKRFRDLSKLNRDPAKIIYVSSHGLETCLQTENTLQIKPWTLEADDTELVDLIPFLEYVATNRPSDIRPVLATFQGQDIGKEFHTKGECNERSTVGVDELGTEEDSFK